MLSTISETQSILKKACFLIILGILLCFFDLGGSFVHESGSQANKWEASEIMGLFFLASYGAHNEHPGGIGIRIDLLNDSVGILLILLGVKALRRLRHDDLYQWCLGLSSAFVVLFGLFSLVDHIVFDQPHWLAEIRDIAVTLLPLMITLFSAAMISLSRDFNAISTLRCWRSTAWLFLIIFIVASSIRATSTQLVENAQDRSTLTIDWLFGSIWIVGLTIGIAYFVAWIFLLVSLFKMRKIVPFASPVEIASPTTPF